ncbi:sulfatase [Algisphaera agarilytica]|uniref:Arylsulfatase A-like enzyme n=1 Tax=Algisphaera agarilytica TaxID=1385975 RepID=A0A7X0H9V5_9BACT|nr:sulfatase [Algisphaera agarilytica]MBB6430495.1 arylsulfatase A-like enzyme [Algisphaera agarilytica]
MKHHASILLGTLLLLLSLSARAAEPAPPNIVFIMIDDLGLYDLHCYGFEAVDTPNIDALAAQGMLFTQAYAASPVCSPARAGTITGQSPARLHLTNHLSRKHFAPENAKVLDAHTLLNLPPETVTYAERLQEAGYACGFFGKWHLSVNAAWPSKHAEDPLTLPDNQGFNNNLGGNGSGGPPSWFSPYNNPYIPDGPEGEYLPYRLADEAIAFMKAHRDRPFLINFWNFTVHSPLGTTPELEAKYKAKRKAGAKMHSPVYTGMIEATDQVVGKLLTALDDLGLADNTLVVLTSDNGGIKGLTHVGDQPPLRMGKGYLYDGGLRVPFIARWPGKVQPGSTSDTRVTHLDLYPTFLETAGLAPDPGRPLDGDSLVAHLTEQTDLDRDAIYFHYPNYAWHSKNRLGSAIIQGDYKLLLRYDDDSVELYNLAQDPGETTDLAADMSELAAELTQNLKAWLKETNARLPVPNPDYVAP